MKILVIEDDEFIAHALTTILTSQNYAVEVANDSQLGWELVEAFDYDLVLLDVMMPDMDGIATLEKLQENPATRSIPVILLTAKIQSSDRRRYAQIGSIAAIAKPFDSLKLAEQVAAALDWEL